MRVSRWKKGIAQVLIAAMLLQTVSYWPSGWMNAGRVYADDPASGGTGSTTVQNAVYGTDPTPTVTPVVTPSPTPTPVVTKDTIEDYAWEKADVNIKPAARTYAAMAYDRANDKVILFGGQGVNNKLADTWLWSGTDKNWNELSPGAKPSARKAAGMAYDETNSRIILFGGEGASGVLSDTWIWDGATQAWTQGPAGPSARAGVQMAWDGTQIVLFGGYKLTGSKKVPVGETWTWDGTAWTQQTPAESPPAMHSGGAAFDGRNMSMYGGDLGEVTKDFTYKPYGGSETTKPFTYDDNSKELWTWDGTALTWMSKAGPSPDSVWGRWGNATAFDGKRWVTYSGEVDLINSASGELKKGYKRPSNLTTLDYNIGHPFLAFGIKNGAWEKPYTQEGNPDTGCLFERISAGEIRCTQDYDWPNSRSFASMAFDGQNFILFGGLVVASHATNQQEKVMDQTWLFGYNPPTPPLVKLAADPLVIFDKVTKNDRVSVIVDVYGTGNKAITERGIEYREIGKTEWKKKVLKGENAESKGSVTDEIKDGLKWQVEFELRGYATNEIGTSYTEIKSFVFKDDPAMLQPELSLIRVGPSVLHAKDTKKIIAVGTNVTNLLRKPVADIHYSLRAVNGTLYPLTANVRNNNELELKWTEELPDGKYDVVLDHDFYADFTFPEALLITSTGFYKPRDFGRVEVPHTGKGKNPLDDEELADQTDLLVLQGPFTEYPDKPGVFVLSDPSEVVTINSYMKFKGTSLTVDKTGKDSVITGVGRLYVNGGNTMGSTLAYTLVDGNFEIESNDFSIDTSRINQAFDYLNMNLPVTVNSIIILDDGIRFAGDIDFSFNIGTTKIKSEAEIEAMEFRRNRFDLAGQFTVGANFKAGPLESAEIRYSLDTRVPYWGAGTTIELKNYNFGFELDMRMKRGKLDALSFAVLRKIKLGNTGAQLTRIGGAVRNMADQTEAPLTLSVLGGLSDVVAPEVKGFNMINASPLNIDLSAYHFGATGKLSVYWISVAELELFLLARANGFKEYNSPGFKVKADIDVFDILIGKILVQYFVNPGFAGALKARVQVPNSIPMVGGKSIASVDVGVSKEEMNAGFSILKVGVALYYNFKKNSFGFDVKLMKVLEDAWKWGKSLFGFGRASFNAGSSNIRIMGASTNTTAFEMTKDGQTLQWRDIFTDEQALGRMKSGKYTALLRESAPQAEITGETITYTLENSRTLDGFLAVKGGSNLHLYGPNGLEVPLVKTVVGRSVVNTVLAGDTTYIRVDMNMTGKWKLITGSTAAVKLYELSFVNPDQDVAALAQAWSASADTLWTSVDIQERGPVVMEISGNPGAVTVYKPDGRPFYLQTADSAAGWNTYADPVSGKLYAFVDAAEAGTWLVDGGGQATVHVYRLGTQATVGDIRNWVQSGIYSTSIVLDSNSEQALLEIEGADNGTELFMPDGTPYLLQFDQTEEGWNAYLDKGLGKLTVLVDKKDAKAKGEWTVKSSRFTDIRAYRGDKSFADLSPIISSGSGQYSRSIFINKAGRYLLAIDGGSLGTELRKPDGTLLPVVLDEKEAGFNAILQEVEDRNKPSTAPTTGGEPPVIETNLKPSGTNDTLFITIDVEQPGLWNIRSLKQIRLDLYEVPPVPEIKKASLTPVAQNQYQLKWNVDHAAPGTRVKVMLTGSADELVGSVIAEGLPSAGIETITLPKNMVPGPYWISIAAESDSYAPLFKVIADPVELVGSFTVPAPDSLQVVSNGNGEVTLEFNSVDNADLSFYRIAGVELDSNGAVVSSETLFDWTPRAGSVQHVALSGLATGKTYQYYVTAVGVKNSGSSNEEWAVSPASGKVVTELPVPQPASGTLSLVTAAKTVERKYTAYYGDEEKLIVTAAEQAELSVESDQNAQLELYVNGELLAAGNVTAGGATTFNLTQLLGGKLAERDYDLTVEMLNDRGDHSSAYSKLFVDRTAPYLYAVGEMEEIDPDTKMNAPKRLNGQPVNVGSKLFITGQTDEGSKLTLNGDIVPVDETGSYAYYAAVKWTGDEERQTMHMIATDEVGNQTDYMFEVTKGEGDPVVPSGLDLAGLAIASGTLRMNTEPTKTQVFKPDLVSYSAVLAEGKVRVYATPAVAGTAVKVNGTAVNEDGYAEVDIPASGKIISVAVGTGNSVKTYTINTLAEKSQVAALSALSLQAGGEELVMEPEFASGKEDYKVYVEAGVTEVTVKPTVYKSGSTVTVKGQALSGASVNIPLVTGENVIPVTVKAPDGVSTRTYKISVYKEKDGNALLQSLEVPGLTGTFDPQVADYSAVVPSSTGKLAVAAAAASPTAQVTIKDNNNGVPLQFGTQVIEVAVKAENGTEQTYRISVLRQYEAASAPPVLTKLAMTTNVLTAEFTPERLSYTAKYSTTSSTLTLQAETDDPAASIYLDGQLIEDGKIPYASLRMGNNVVLVQVESADRTAAQTYSIAIKRNSPERNVRTVPVAIGKEQGETVEIERIKTITGVKVDAVNLNVSKTMDIIKKAKEQKRDSVTILITDLPDDPAEEIQLDVPVGSLSLFSSNGIALTINTPDADVELDKSSISKLQEKGVDLYFRIVPINDSVQRGEVEERTVNSELVIVETAGGHAQVIGKPMTIETNYSGIPTKLVFPLNGLVLPENPEAARKVLDQLSVYIEHSDGEKALQRGTIRYDDNGVPVGIEIGITKFSTFSIVRVTGEEGTVVDPYMAGYPDKTFRPEQAMTRAELATVLDRVLSASKDTKQADSADRKQSPYPDVPFSYWAQGAILSMYIRGLMVGDEQGLFQPEGLVTRAEIAVIAARWQELAGIPANADAAAGFTDTEGHWAEKEIRLAQAAGLISGYSDATFRPDASLTRAEAVRVLNGLFMRPALTGVKNSIWPDVPADHWAIGEIDSASSKLRVFKDGSVQVEQK